MTSPVLQTNILFTITARIGEVTTASDIGHGVRRIIPIIGGAYVGMSTARSWRSARTSDRPPNELIELEAKYAGVLETDDGATVYVENGASGSGRCSCCRN